MIFRRPALLLALLAVSLVGCGEDEGVSAAGSGSESLASLAPASSAIYVEAAVRPEGEVREDLLAAVGKVGGTDDPQGLVDQLFSKFTKEGDGPSVDYKREVEPWLGERVAVFGQDLDAKAPEVAFAVSTRDVDRAREAVAAIIKREAPGAKPGSYKDAKFTRTKDGDVAGFVDDVLVIGPEGVLRRVVDTADGGASLEESGKLEKATKDLAEPRLVTGYLDSKVFVNQSLKGAAPQAEQLRRLVDLESLEPTGFGLLADGDRIVMDSAVSTKGVKGLLAKLLPLLGGGSTPLLGELPADAVGVYGVPKVGEIGRTTFREAAGAFGGAAVAAQLESAYGIELERDLFSWVGDVAAFVRGDDPKTLEGGVVIAATDAAKARQAITRLIGVATQKVPGFKADSVSVDGADLAFEATLPGQATSGWIGLGDDRVVMVSSRTALADGLDPDEKLADAEGYKNAQGALDDTAPVFFVDVPRILGLAERSGATQGSEEYAKAKPYLERIAAAVQGAKSEDGLVRSQLGARLK